MPTGLDQLQHIVVLMMENRSFDHMLGSLKAVDNRIDGVTDQLNNPDTTGAPVKPQPRAEFQGQLDPDPDHRSVQPLAIAVLEPPPRRFIAGADAVATAEQVAADLKAQTDAHRDLSTSLAFD